MEDGVIIIHTERCTEEEREEIARGIANYLTNNYPYILDDDIATS